MTEENNSNPNKPVINNYQKNTNDLKVNQVQQTNVNPSEGVPPAQNEVNNQPSQSPQVNRVQNPQTVQQNQVAQTNVASPQPAPAATNNGQVANASTQNPAPVKKKKKLNKKKLIIGCSGLFLIFMVVSLILSFVFIAQSGEGSSNPIASALGLNEASFINGLITYVNIIFLLFALILFVVTIAGIVKIGMAKKEEKEKKKTGIKISVLSGAFLLITLVAWFFIGLSLDSKRQDPNAENALPPIVTTPEDTLGLTAPAEITFDASNVPFDRSRYRVLTYKWEFGDGGEATEEIVTHTYQDKGTNDGRFEVELTVSLVDSQTGEEPEPLIYNKTVTIANQAISAIFSYEPQSGEAPLEVDFDATESVDPDGTIASYEWDFDDDGEFDDAEGENVTYTFEQNGDYDVSLRVVSTTGDFAVSTETIEVDENLSPEAVIDTNNTESTFLANIEYVFNADDSESPNGDIVQYEWDFGDGTPVVRSRSTNHTFTKEGRFEISLTVVDETGKESTTTEEVTVGTPPGSPEAVLITEPALAEGELSISGKAPFTVVFNAENSTDPNDDIINYEWDFDSDGTSDAFGANAQFEYRTPGTYTATLKVTDSEDNTGAATVVVEVQEQGITAQLSTDKVEGSVPLTVRFDASGSNYEGGQIVSYKWEFGDGSAPEFGSSSIQKRYTSIGTYTAKVTVVGSDNTTDTAETIITVREIPLSACFNTVFTSGPAPLETSFDPGCSTGTVASYFWDFGDGTTSSELKPKHTFENPGQYTVTLEVATPSNVISTTEQLITVTQ